MTIDEGYTKFDCRWTECALPGLPEIAELCRWRKPLFVAGLIGEYPEINVGFGNISVRIGHSADFLISGTQTGHLEQVDAHHFALVSRIDFEQNRVDCSGPVPASSESMTHAALYRIDDSIRAVVHVHSELLWRHLKGIIPTTSDNIAYGTPEMAREFERIYRQSDFRHTGIAVMGGHDEGIVAIGRSMSEAATRILDLQEKHRA